MVTTIRPFKKNDLNRITKIILINHYHIHIRKFIGIIIHYQKFKKSTFQDIQSMDEFHVLEKNGSIIGCGGVKQLIQDGRKIVESRLVHIEWKQRGNKYGTQLLENNIKIAEKMGYDYIYSQIIDYEPTRKWVLKYGFEQVDEPWFNGKNIVVRYPLKHKNK